jgi:hypothetical protein
MHLLRHFVIMLVGLLTLLGVHELLSLFYPYYNTPLYLLIPIGFILPMTLISFIYIDWVI